MNTEERRKIALFRYGILAPLISGTNEDGQSIKEFFCDVTTVHSLTSIYLLKR